MLRIRPFCLDLSAAEIDEGRTGELRACNRRMQGALDRRVVTDHRAIADGLRGDFDQHGRRFLGVLDLLVKQSLMEGNDADADEQQPGRRIQAHDPRDERFRQGATYPIH